MAPSTPRQDMTLALGRATQEGDTLTRSERPVWRFGGAELVRREDEVWGLHMDLDVLDGLIERQGYVLGARPSAADFAIQGQLSQLAIIEPTSAAISRISAACRASVRHSPGALETSNS